MTTIYLSRSAQVQPVSYKRYFRCNNCFLLLVYIIHLSLSTDLVDPPPMGTIYMKHPLAKSTFSWNPQYFMISFFLLQCLIYSPFHKTLPKSSLRMHCFSVRFYEMGNIRYMADHAGGGRYSVVNPVEVTQFWRPRSGFGQKKDYIDQEAGD